MNSKATLAGVLVAVLVSASLPVRAAKAQTTGAIPPPPLGVLPPAPPPATLVITANDAVEVDRARGPYDAPPPGTYAAPGGWDVLCMAPCTVLLRPGEHELALNDDGKHTLTKKLALQPGENHLKVDAGMPALQKYGGMIGALGLVTLIVGVSVWAGYGKLSDSNGNKAGGVRVGRALTIVSIPITGIGIAMYFAGAPSMDLEGAPRVKAARLPMVPGVSLGGVF